MPTISYLNSDLKFSNDKFQFKFFCSCQFCISNLALVYSLRPHVHLHKKHHRQILPRRLFSVKQAYRLIGKILFGKVKMTSFDRD